MLCRISMVSGIDAACTCTYRDITPEPVVTRAGATHETLRSDAFQLLDPNTKLRLAGLKICAKQLLCP